MNETAFSFDPDWMGTLTAPFMTNAFLAGLCIALAAGVMGYFTIARSFHVRRACAGAHRTARSDRSRAVGSAGQCRSRVFALGGALVIGALGKKASQRRNRHRNRIGVRHRHGSVFRTLVQFRLAADAIDSFRLHPDDHGRADRRICGFRRVVAGRFGRYLSTAAVQLA